MDQIRVNRVRGLAGDPAAGTLLRSGDVGTGAAEGQHTGSSAAGLQQMDGN